MNSIDKIDRNFEVKTIIEDTLNFFSSLDTPFRIHGLISTPKGFARMPEETAMAVNEGVAMLFRNTAGGRLRFRTNSPKVAIRAKMDNIGKMPHFALSGSAGFDLYEGSIYRGTFIPPFDIEDGYESMIVLSGIKERDLTVHFPLYSNVISLEIGLCEGATLSPAPDYGRKLPVVYYGSSITQGGCASRPGNCYENIISRSLDCDHINLGFSGSARGEDVIADYIANLPMSVFVYDYDHNAPSVEHLRNTHRPMFRRIRENNPLLPIVMVSRPQPNPTAEELQRRDIIRSTYEEASAAGDRNVYFIDGSAMLGQFGGDSGTVDSCHPNDLGFMCMAKSIGEVVERILNRSTPL
ncbi:MAG: hypothetical protein HFH90_09805 [Lachnospiraceae bacterium]|jgi:hypothetical protein|nr:hypothetical protein [Lachnospiraceae bacterium]